MIRISGESFIANTTAARPEVASPTISKSGSFFRRAQSPLRMILWSSATRRVMAGMSARIIKVSLPGIGSHPTTLKHVILVCDGKKHARGYRAHVFEARLVDGGAG